MTVHLIVLCVRRVKQRVAKRPGKDKEENKQKEHKTVIITHRLFFLGVFNCVFLPKAAMLGLQLVM